MLDFSQPILVSIIVNNYNYARYLPAAIDSALRQTHDAVEVIVVDDGSTDDSQAVIQSYGPAIIPLYQHNAGQAAALNLGFACSRGDIVIFLDADDMLLRETAARAVEAFRNRPDAAKVMVRMEVIDAQGKATGTLKPAAHLPLTDGDLQRQTLAFPSDMTWMPTSGNAFAAGVLRQVMPVPTEYGRIGADWYVSQVTPLFGPVIFLDWVGAYYRVHRQNNYEQAENTINLAQVRQTMKYASCTYRYIEQYAVKLGLLAPGSAGEDRSIAALANRMISLKLSPSQHPYPGDSAWRLVSAGVKAAVHRFDVSWPMRALFAAWFTAMACTPGTLARPLAEIFVYPEKRGALNRVLSGFHRV